MAERRTLALLDCAIAASAALVPVMVGVVAVVALVRPAGSDAGGRAERSDNYVSVRHIAALKTFEAAIVARPAAAPAAVGGADVLAGIDACRREWRAEGAALQALRTVFGGAATGPSPADGIARRLDELDAALRRYSTRPGGRFAQPVGLDASRWFVAASEALAVPVRADDATGGPSLRLRCADLVTALDMLRRADAAVLAALTWRGGEGGAVAAGWPLEQQMQVAAHAVTRRNPWRGAAGCLYLGGAAATATSEATPPRYFLAGARSLQRQLCPTAALSGDAAPPDGVAALPPPLPLAGEPGPADAVDDPRWAVPPSLMALLRPLETLRQPTGALYRAYTDAGAPVDPLAPPGAVSDRRHRMTVDGAPVDVGFSIDLTIDPAVQALAQKTAACYTGRHDVCRALGMHRREEVDGAVGAPLLEGAMVRMAAIAVIDVASGRIEALAGALSPCARAAVDGGQRAGGCDPRLLGRASAGPDALLNPAVYHDAMPASTIKPILAASFLSEPGAGARLLAAERADMARDGTPARDSLRGQLMRSDSARFLDRMFCIETAFAGCRRPWDIQQTARAFGWNAGCEVGERCGQADLLFGRPLQAPTLRPDRASTAERPDTAAAPAPTIVAYGRLLSEPGGKDLGGAMHAMPPLTLAADVLRRCAAGADGRRRSDDDWEKCRGGAVVDVVAEGWGQGHARASALGVAGMMASLAAAANGATVRPRPHLVESVHGLPGAGDAVHADAQRWSGSADAAAHRLPSISRDAAEVILSGLSYSHRAGTARSACEQVLDARRCLAMDWLAGKTGTPSFPGDHLSLEQIDRLCHDAVAAATPLGRGACGSLRPYKWYVATYRADRSAHAPWSKAIAVLTERNWLRANGRVHGAGDHGPNPAAEIALQIVARRAGLLEASAP